MTRVTVHIADLADDKAVLGESLEAALEQGEKHEAFATKCMEVQPACLSACLSVCLSSLYPIPFPFHRQLMNR